MKSLISRKRSLPQSFNIGMNEPLRKKQKLDNDYLTANISSTLFLNSYDHQQFEQIFKIIDNSELIQSLNVAQFINKEIAEYATGQLVKCENNKCQNQISILHQDKQIYDNNHNNANILGYKWCYESNKYFCCECMDDAQTSICYDKCCMKLKYIPDCNKCKLCKAVLFGCQCICRCNYEWHCNSCDFIACFHCNGTKQCVGCKQIFCKHCRVDLDGLDLDGLDQDCVCNQCYDDTIIECNQCNAKCELLYKANKVLCSYSTEDNNIHYKMEKCGHKDCDIFICFNCDEKQSNGKVIMCREPYCCSVAEIRCNKHTSDHVMCWRHLLRL